MNNTNGEADILTTLFTSQQQAVPCAGKGSLSLEDPIGSKSRLMLQGYTRSKQATLNISLKGPNQSSQVLTPTMSGSSVTIQLPELNQGVDYILNLGSNDGLDYTVSFKTFDRFALVSQKNITGHMLSLTGTQTGYQGVNPL
jgi:hypothetical protein